MCWENTSYGNQLLFYADNIDESVTKTLETLVGIQKRVLFCEDSTKTEYIHMAIFAALLHVHGEGRRKKLIQSAALIFKKITPLEAWHWITGCSAAVRCGALPQLLSMRNMVENALTKAQREQGGRQPNGRRLPPSESLLIKDSFAGWRAHRNYCKRLFVAVIGHKQNLIRLVPRPTSQTAVSPRAYKTHHLLIGCLWWRRRRLHCWKGWWRTTRSVYCSCAERILYQFSLAAEWSRCLPDAETWVGARQHGSRCRRRRAREEVVVFCVRGAAIMRIVYMCSCLESNAIYRSNE